MGTRSTLTGFLAVLLLMVTVPAGARENDYNDFGGGGGGGGGGGFDSFDFGGGGKSCKSFKCSSGFEAAQKRPMKLTASGCSSMGVYAAGQSDDGPMGDCCNKRTACFQTCGMSKSACDKAFDACAATACDKSISKEEKERCESAQKIQSLMASMGGCKDYDAGQQSSCQCMAPEKAIARRDRVLRDFYKKFNPENEASKVPALVEKSGSNNKKFAALMTQLIGKYPAAIKVKKSEQQEMMDRIMRESKRAGDEKDAEDAARFDDIDLDLDAETGGGGAAAADGDGGLDEDDLDAVLRGQEL
jgi:hypothetical protein